MVDLAETVSAAQDGCPEAFSTLFRETYEDTYLLALRLVGNAEDANDVVQDTYLRAFGAIRRFRGDAQIGTWLYRITSNAANTLLQRRRNSAHAELAGDAGVADLSRERNPEERAENADMRTQLLVALSTLPTKLRSVIVLRDIYDLSHDAIAEQLGISESAAKVRLFRARQKLREQLFDDTEKDSEKDKAKDKSKDSFDDTHKDNEPAVDAGSERVKRPGGRSVRSMTGPAVEVHRHPDPATLVDGADRPCGNVRAAGVA